MKAELLVYNKMKGLMFKMENNLRITKVGKFMRRISLDEFPQFLNTKRGYDLTGNQTTYSW